MSYRGGNRRNNLCSIYAFIRRVNYFARSLINNPSIHNISAGNKRVGGETVNLESSVLIAVGEVLVEGIGIRVVIGAYDYS